MLQLTRDAVADHTSALRASLDRHATEAPAIQLVLVDRTGVIFDHHTGFADLETRRPIDADTTFMAYSMSKTITAAAVLQLVDAKAIALDDPIAGYIPSQPYGNHITARHVANRSSRT